MMRKEKNDKRRLERRKQRGLSLRSQETSKFSPIMNYKKSEKDQTMNIVKESESSEEKEGLKKTGELQFNAVVDDDLCFNTIEIGNDKENSKDLILGVKTKSYNRFGSTVYRNKSRNKIINGDIEAQSRNDKIDSAESIKTYAELGCTRLLDRLKLCTKIGENVETTLDDVLPFLNNEEKKLEIEELENIKPDLNNKRMIQNIIDKKTNEIMEDKKTFLNFYQKFRLVLSDFEKFKNSGDAYIFYLKKKWLVLMPLEKIKIFLVEDIPIGIKDIMLDLYSKCLSCDEIGEILGKFTQFEIESEIILDSLKSQIEYFYENSNKNFEEEVKTNSCMILLIKEISVSIKHAKQKVYIMTGFLTNGKSEKLQEKVLKCSIDFSDIISKINYVFSDLLENNDCTRLLVSSEEIIKKIKGSMLNKNFDEYILDIYETLKQITEVIVLDLDEIENDIKLCRELSMLKEELLLKWKDTWIESVFNIEQIIYDYSISYKELLKKSMIILDSDVKLILRNNDLDIKLVKEIEKKWRSKKLKSNFVDIIDELIQCYKKLEKGDLSYFKYEIINNLSLYREWEKDIALNVLNYKSFSQEEVLMVIVSIMIKIFNNRL